MRNFALAAIVAVALASGANASNFPKKVYCPYCHHWMTQKKTREHFVAVRPDPRGPVYYCCRCSMPKKWFVKKMKKITSG